MNSKRDIFFPSLEKITKKGLKNSNKPTQINDTNRGKRVDLIVICMIGTTGIIWNLKAIRSGSLVDKQVKTEYLEFSWFPPTTSMGRCQLKSKYSS